MKQRVIIISVVGVLALGIGILLYLGAIYTPDYNWNEGYRPYGKQPYDLGIFSELLETNAQEVNTLKITTLDEIDTLKGTLFIYPEQRMLDSTSTIKLMNWVENGNNVVCFDLYTIEKVINGRRLNYGNKNKFKAYTRSVPLWNGAVCLPGKEEPLRYPHRLLKEDAIRNWTYLPLTTIEEIEQELPEFQAESMAELTPHGSLAFAMKNGAGHIITIIDPIIVSNYHMIQPRGREVGASILAKIPDEQVIYKLDRRFVKQSSPPKHKTDLAFFLAQPGLRACLYLIIGLALIYLIFNRARKQRVIPIMTMPKNYTLGFIQSVAVLYRNKGKAEMIAEELFQLFTDQVKRQYSIEVTIDNDDWVQPLSHKSGVKLDVIASILEKAQILLRSKQEGKKDLTYLYVHMNQFWRNKR